MTPSDEILSRKNEALEVLSDFPDEVVRFLGDRVFAAAHNLVISGTRPCGTFDMEFLMKVIAKALKDEALIRRTISGQRPGEWPDS